MSLSAGTVTAVLNGLSMTFDETTGSILSMEYAGKTMLKTDAANASIIDVAYPVPEFEPLRLASRFSENAQVSVSENRVVVSWDRLGASRAKFAPEGDVSAAVIFEALPDGRSISARCRVENKSEKPVEQVIFPDFAGLQPFEGDFDTILKHTAGYLRPFIELRMDENRKSTQYCMDGANGQTQMSFGGMFRTAPLRWLDYGGFGGGISMFPKLWGWDEQIPVRVHLANSEKEARLLMLNTKTIEPGARFDSAEWIFTPHTSGWAKGIEVFREFAQKKHHRKYPLSKHIAEAVGIRSIWMATGWGYDEMDPQWRIKDMPALAKESGEYGLSEINAWGWGESWFETPMRINRQVGTEKEMFALKDCYEKYGCYFTPFVSVLLQNPESAKKWNATGNPDNWTQGQETIPQFQPSYNHKGEALYVGPASAAWKDSVYEDLSKYIDAGLANVSWDQFWNDNPEKQMFDLAKRLIDRSKSVDPDSSFSGEELWTMEFDVELLDYTWDWGGHNGYDAFNSVFKYPRINVNNSGDAKKAKNTFIVNNLVNAMPRKLEHPSGNIYATGLNGNDWMKNHPDLGTALKHLKAIKEKWMPYFTEGTFISDCLQTRPSSWVSMGAYVYDDSVVMPVMNNRDDARVLELYYDLVPWIGEAGSYTMEVYDETLNLIDTQTLQPGEFKVTTPELKSADMLIYFFKKN